MKFKDADLRGIPLRVTISKRSLEKGGVEFKRRGEKDFEIVPTDEIIGTLKNKIEALYAELNSGLDEVPTWDGK